jgi:hypothetical protein
MPMLYSVALRLVVPLGLVMQVSAQIQPPRILLVHRDPLKPGVEEALGEIEEDAARFCAELGGPHPYLAIESLSGPKEVWFFNGFASAAEQERVLGDYEKNTRLMAALEQIGKRKADLVLNPVEAFANYNHGLSRGAPWSVGLGRFLVITVTKSATPANGTVFETADGTKFVIQPARTREEAEAKATAAGPETNVFAVRPRWSLPAQEWIAADPEFWRPGA